MTTTAEKKTKKPKANRGTVVDKTVKDLRAKLKKAEEQRSKHQDAMDNLTRVINSLRQALAHLDPTSDFEDPAQTWEGYVLDNILAGHPNQEFSPKKIFSLLLSAPASTYRESCPSTVAVQRLLATQAADEDSPIIKIRRGVYRYDE